MRIGTPTPTPIPTPSARALLDVLFISGGALHYSATVTGPILVKLEPLVPVPQNASNY